MLYSYKYIYIHWFYIFTHKKVRCDYCRKIFSINIVQKFKQHTWIILVQWIKNNIKSTPCTKLSKNEFKMWWNISLRWKKNVKKRYDSTPSFKFIYQNLLCLQSYFQNSVHEISCKLIIHIRFNILKILPSYGAHAAVFEPDF